MAGNDLTLHIATGFREEAKAFFDFLRQTARLHRVAFSVGCASGADDEERQEIFGIQD
jgi:hypothetical protein